MPLKSVDKLRPSLVAQTPSGLGARTSDPILLLTEVGTNIGFGHLTRCLSLAHAFQRAGVETKIWAATHDTNPSVLPCEIHSVDWYGLRGDLARDVAEFHAILVDSYAANLPDLEKVYSAHPQVAVIDDYLRRDYTKGLVIDWTVGAEGFAFQQKHPNVRYLLGSQYCALRPEFQGAVRRCASEEIRNVLITFGGTDIQKLTRPVLERLQREFPALEKHVVIGAGSKGASIPPDPDQNTSYHIAVSALDMRTLMQQADIVICGGGQTLYEAASQGLPPVMITLVQNQHDDIREFARAGFGIHAETWDAPDLLECVVAAVRSLSPIEVRVQHQIAGQRCVDGNGAERLVNILLAEWSKFPAKT